MSKWKITNVQVKHFESGRRVNLTLETDADVQTANIQVLTIPAILEDQNKIQSVLDTAASIKDALDDLGETEVDTSELDEEDESDEESEASEAGPQDEEDLVGEEESDGGAGQDDDGTPEDDTTGDDGTSDDGPGEAEPESESEEPPGGDAEPEQEDTQPEAPSTEAPEPGDFLGRVVTAIIGGDTVNGEVVGEDEQELEVRDLTGHPVLIPRGSVVDTFEFCDSDGSDPDSQIRMYKDLCASKAKVPSWGCVILAASVAAEADSIKVIDGMIVFDDDLVEVALEVSDRVSE